MAEKIRLKGIERVGAIACMVLASGLYSQVQVQAQTPVQRSVSAGNVSQSNVPVAVRSQPSLDRRYVLGAGDVLQMEIFNLPDYSRSYQVAVDGTMALPLIGSVQAQDLTLEQLEAVVSQRYRRFIREPILTFELQQARPLQIVIAGEVNRPGSYTLPMTEQGEVNTMAAPTLTQMIQMADGITQSADIRQIAIYRRNPQTPGQPAVAVVSLWDLLTAGNPDADIALRDGDSIQIPTATSIDAAEATTLASASFSPNEMSVYVVGEVDAPGLVKVPPNTPLNQALLAAGGFSERAQTASVELVRLNVNGTVDQRDIQVDLASNVDSQDNPLLQENDTIVVSRSGSAAFADAASNFTGPFGLIINMFRALSGN